MIFLLSLLVAYLFLCFLGKYFSQFFHTHCYFLTYSIAGYSTSMRNMNLRGLVALLQRRCVAIVPLSVFCTCLCSLELELLYYCTCYLLVAVLGQTSIKVDQDHQVIALSDRIGEFQDLFQPFQISVQNVQCTVQASGSIFSWSNVNDQSRLIIVWRIKLHTISLKFTDCEHTSTKAHFPGIH